MKLTKEKSLLNFDIKYKIDLKQHLHHNRFYLIFIFLIKLRVARLAKCETQEGPGPHGRKLRNKITLHFNKILYLNRGASFEEFATSLSGWYNSATG